MYTKTESSNESLDFPNINDPELPKKLKHIRENILKMSVYGFETKANLPKGSIRNLEKKNMESQVPIDKDFYKAVKLYAIGKYISEKKVHPKLDISKLDFKFKSAWITSAYDPQNPKPPKRSFKPLTLVKS